MPPGPTRSAGRTALGCLAYLVIFGALAVAIDRWLAPQVVADACPWLGLVAAAFFTLALGAAWTVVSGWFGRGVSRAAILERAAAGTVPDEDGVALVTGRVRATGAPLLAPLSGTPCVAYTYRMFYVVSGHRGRRQEVPVYWGLACRPFVVDTRLRAVRVMAVPRLVDEPARHAGPDVLTRARRHIADTRFEEAAGLLGALGTVFRTVGVMFGDDDGEHRADYRAAGAVRAPENLLLEETVLPVGASASVAGAWSAARGAIVPQSGSSGGGGVTATTGAVQTLLKHGSPVPPSKVGAAVAALTLAAIGAGILWAGLTLLAPGTTFGAP